MIKPQTTTEKLMFATLRIEADLANRETSVGTAFLFRFNVDDQRGLPVIITNKHVVEGAATGKFKVHLADRNDPNQPADQSEYIALSNFEQGFFMHPDPDVDLCAMPVQPLFDTVQSQGKTIFASTFDESMIPTQAQLDDLSAVENILMVGYPNGLWDEVNNLPLFRKGITSSHPAVDHNGKSITVIDAACFPGSSGSPVVLYDNGMYTDKLGNTHIGGMRLMLLGVLSKGPQIAKQGAITVEDIPTTQAPVATTLMTMHLGYIVKSKEIVTLGKTMIDDFERRGLLKLPTAI